jgi:hypothetical protein
MQLRVLPGIHSAIGLELDMIAAVVTVSEPERRDGSVSRSMIGA